MKKIVEYTMPDAEVMQLFEPVAVYVASSPEAALFSVEQFSVLNQSLPLTQQEWAQVLHISDRTLQRYIKENKPFEGLHAEHLHQIKRVTDLGLKVFDSSESFESWVRRSKFILGQEVGLSALFSFGGTQLLWDELGRILHGVYI